MSYQKLAIKFFHCRSACCFGQTSNSEVWKVTNDYPDNDF